MAKLSSYRRIYKQDFQDEYQELVDQLSVPINAAFDEIYDSLNNKLSFSENLNCTIATFNVTVNAAGTPQRATQFKLASTQTTLEGLFVINAYGTKDASVLPTSGVFIQFSKNEGSVNVKNIKGLQADTQYTIKVVAIG